MRASRAIAVVTLLLVVAQTARAEDPAHEAARAHFRRGERFYAVAKFQEALDEFTAAYETKPLPEILFNLGQCQRRLNHPDEALFFYQGYLSRVTDPPDRGEVDKLMGEMRDRIAHPRADSSVASPVYRRWWFWTTIVAVVAAGAAVAIGVAWAERTPSLTYPGVTF